MNPKFQANTIFIMNFKPEFRPNKIDTESIKKIDLGPKFSSKNHNKIDKIFVSKEVQIYKFIFIAKQFPESICVREFGEMEGYDGHPFVREKTQISF